MNKRMRRASFFVEILILIFAFAKPSFALQWPLPSTTVTSGYGWRQAPNLAETKPLNSSFAPIAFGYIWVRPPKWHNGIDIRATMYTPIQAVATGQIDFIRSDSAGGGNRIRAANWNYVHLANSREPDWIFFEEDVYQNLYFAITRNGNITYYSRAPKLFFDENDLQGIDTYQSLTEGEFFAISGAAGTGPHLHLINYNGGDLTKSPLIDLYGANDAPKNLGTPYVSLPYFDDVTKMVLSLAGTWDGELDLNKFNVLADGVSVHEISFSPRQKASDDDISYGTKTGILPAETTGGGQYIFYKVNQGTCSFSSSGLNSIAIKATDAGEKEYTSRPLPIRIWPSISCPGGGHPDDNYSVADITDLPPEEEYKGDPIWITPRVAILKDGFVPEMGNLLTQRRIRYTFKLTDVSSFDLAATDLIIIPSGGLHGLWNSDTFKKGLDDYVKAGGKVAVFSQQHGFESF